MVSQASLSGTNHHPYPEFKFMKYLLFLTLFILVSPLRAGDEPGFVSLFNGVDLNGWDAKPDHFQFFAVP